MCGQEKRFSNISDLEILGQIISQRLFLTSYC